MKTRKFILPIVIVLSMALIGCGASASSPAKASANENASDNEKETQPVKINSDNSKSEDANSDIEDEDDTASVEEPLQEEGKKTSARLSLAQSIGPDGCAVFEVCDYIYITPEDTELIKKYGFEPDLDGYDYEVVESEDGPQILSAFDNCKIEIIEWDKNETEYKTITLEEFCEYLKGKSGPIQVLYEKDDFPSSFTS